MKKQIIVWLLLFIATQSIHTMNQQQPEYKQNPMDALWFYDTTQVFAEANKYHQKQEWAKAAKLYSIIENNKTLHKHIFPYDLHSARLNFAACLMAQKKATQHWSSFDILLNIPESRQIPSDLIKNVQQNKKTQTILVRTDLVGIGDIFCFLSVIDMLKKLTDWNIIVSVRNFLKPTLENAAKEYNFQLLSEKEPQPITDYETHLIALLGHLKVTPTQMNPEKVVFIAPDKAINIVLEQITPILKQGNTVIIADRGEIGRQATLIGGKQLPHDIHNWGRHLDSEPFNALLKKHSHLVVMDCSNNNNRITVDNTCKQQYFTIAPEQQPFDTIIALGCIMSKTKNMIAFGPDMGQTNVFARCLDHNTQNRMAFIIPNSHEHDMRMEGEGKKYKHMLSNCWVYKCNTPYDQTNVIETAYLDMIKY